MLYWFSLNPSEPKHQVVHEQKFKDLLISKCQVSVERIVLDLESEAALVPTGGNILSLDVFHVVKASDVNIANIVNLRKTQLYRSSCT